MDDKCIRSRSNIEIATDADKAVAELYSRRIGLELLGMNRETAVLLVDEAIRTLSAPQDHDYYSRPVSSITSVRTANALENYLDVSTIGDLLSVKYASLLEVPEISHLTIHGLMCELVKTAIRWGETHKREADRLRRARSTGQPANV